MSDERHGYQITGDSTFYNALFGNLLPVMRKSVSVLLRYRVHDSMHVLQEWQFFITEAAIADELV